jgi:16S rRNA (uracil1498-N3)-methyltransferase
MGAARGETAVRSHRAFVAKLEPTITLTGREFDHLRVLRANVGDHVTVFDGAGLEAGSQIVSTDEISITLELGEIRAVTLEPPQHITLAIGLLKADKLADVVRACTELGVNQFQLLITEFSDAKEIGSQKLERLRRVALEAAKQCRRSIVPEILEPIKLIHLEPTVLNSNLCSIVAHPGSGIRAREVVNWDSPVTVITGPEGGFSGREIELLESRGVRQVGLGPRILRAETAPIALIAALTAAENL